MTTIIAYSLFRSSLSIFRQRFKKTSSSNSRHHCTIFELLDIAFSDIDVRAEEDVVESKIFVRVQVIVVKSKIIVRFEIVERLEVVVKSKMFVFILLMT